MMIMKILSTDMQCIVNRGARTALFFNLGVVRAPTGIKCKHDSLVSLQINKYSVLQGLAVAN